MNWTMINFQQRRNVRIVAIGDEEPVAGNEVDEAAKTVLDLREVFKNVRMVELKIVEHSNFR